MYLQRRPGDELQPDQRVEELGQAQAYVRVPVAGEVKLPPHLEAGLYAVQRVEVVHNVLKDLLRLLINVIYR